MTAKLTALSAGLPDSIPLPRHCPERVRFTWKDWDPTRVTHASVLPQYLILGSLDVGTFTRVHSGWSARW